MDLSSIYMQLTVMLNGIDRELTKLLSAESIPLAPSASHERLGEQLEQWTRQAGQLTRILSIERNAIELQSSRIPGLPREARYSVRQSVTDRNRNVEQAFKALAIVRGRLDMLFDRLGRPTGPEILKALEKLTTGAFKQVELTQAATRELQSLTMKLPGPTLRGASQTVAPDMLVSLAVIGRLLHILALRFARRSRGGGMPS
jgi:hypothetical protein